MYCMCLYFQYFLQKYLVLISKNVTKYNTIDRNCPGFVDRSYKPHITIDSSLIKIKLIMISSIYLWILQCNISTVNNIDNIKYYWQAAQTVNIIDDPSIKIRPILMSSIYWWILQYFILTISLTHTRSIILSIYNIDQFY
jgi:hypothetical protein